MSNNEYNSEQLKIVNGDIPLEVVSTRMLRLLVEKAEANNDADLASKLKVFLLNKQTAHEVDLLRKKAERRISNKFAHQNVESIDYTEKELSIINSSSSLDSYSSNALTPIYDKALFKNDDRVALRMEKILSQRSLNHKAAVTRKRTLEASAYTETQLKVIHGEISLKDISSYQLVWFNKKALLNGDLELSQKIQDQIDFTKKQTTKKNHKANKANDKALLKNGEPLWREPVTTKYTPRQEQIVRGEIPFDKVHANSLINIYMKARAVGDMELAESLYAEILSKRKISAKNMLIKSKNINRIRKNISKNKNENVDSGLTVLEEALLDGDIFWSEFTVGEIKNLIKKLEGTGDEYNLALAQNILYHKEHPRPKYTREDQKRAIEDLEVLLKTQFKKPKDWYD